MNLLIVVLSIVVLAVALNQLISILDDRNQRKKMKHVEQNLEKAGVTAYGSTLSHGMYIDKRTNQLSADQKLSVVWYKRLI